MQTRFSKSLGDIAEKSLELTQTDGVRHARIRRATADLAGCPERKSCPVCGAALIDALSFIHRGQPYRRCRTCSHILLGCQPPDAYPRQDQDGFAFNAIYPPRDAAATATLRRLVYQPKLDWILDAATVLGRTRKSLLEAVWVELGCGEGQFLAALQEAGAGSLTGYEADPVLAERANQALGGGQAVVHSQAPLGEIVAQSQGEVYCAFFVLEHIADLNELFRSIAEKPAGTIFALSVPVFSLATVLESAFDLHAPRNLDSVIHTQLFTDASIRYCLDIGKLTPVAQWIFGQDAADMRRLLRLALSRVYPDELLAEVDGLLARMEEPFQELVDRTMFCDARHVLAIRQ